MISALGKGRLKPHKMPGEEGYYLIPFGLFSARHPMLFGGEKTQKAQIYHLGLTNPLQFNIVIRG
jgi:hypothetical protein